MRKITLAVAAMAMLGATNLSAQQADATGSVTITIGKVAYIALTSGGDVGFATPTSAEFEDGEILASNDVPISYGSNVAHDLQIELDDLGGKDVADLQWSVDGGSSWTPMTTAAANMVSQGTGGLNNATVDFKMLLSWADDADGTYSGTITYTVVAN